MADNIAIKDGAGSAVTVKSTDNAGVHTPHQNAQLVVAGAAVAAANPVPVSGGGFSSAASQTRPNDTTAYDAGDVCGADPGANLEFAGIGSVAAAQIIITGASLRIDVNAVPSGMTDFRLHLYSAAPTAIADKAAYNLPAGDRAKYLGYVTIPVPADLGDTLFSRVDGLCFKTKLADASTTLYGILETRAAFTPSAQTAKTVTIEGVPA